MMPAAQEEYERAAQLAQRIILVEEKSLGPESPELTKTLGMRAAALEGQVNQR